MLSIIARCAYVYRVIDLVARTELQPGDAVTLDYGSRPMRDLLRNYCFMPSDAAKQLPHEVRGVNLCTHFKLFKITELSDRVKSSTQDGKFCENFARFGMSTMYLIHCSNCELTLAFDDCE